MCRGDLFAPGLDYLHCWQTFFLNISWSIEVSWRLPCFESLAIQHSGIIYHLIQSEQYYSVCSWHIILHNLKSQAECSWIWLKQWPEVKFHGPEAACFARPLISWPVWNIDTSILILTYSWEVIFCLQSFDFVHI
jgi:hypothetical protein